MDRAQSHERGAEQKLAALNAKAEASRMQDADDWEDAASEAAFECARWCETRSGSSSFAVDPDGF